MKPCFSLSLPLWKLFPVSCKYKSDALSFLPTSSHLNFFNRNSAEYKMIVTSGGKYNIAETLHFF